MNQLTPQTDIEYAQLPLAMSDLEHQVAYPGPKQTWTFDYFDAHVPTDTIRSLCTLTPWEATGIP